MLSQDTAVTAICLRTANSNFQSPAVAKRAPPMGQGNEKMLDIRWKFAKNPHTGKNVSIEEANRLATGSKFKPAYKCLDCGRPMDPKKGPKKRHHFAHRSDDVRAACQGEGARHWTAKINLEQFIRKHKKFSKLRVSDVSIERRTPSGLRADLRILFDSKRKEKNVLYVEIVDKNPPDDRKKVEFEGRMVVFEIKKYDDDQIDGNHFLPDFVKELEVFIERKKAKREKCSALANSGHKCKNYPIKGEKLCQYHRPRKKGYYRRRAYIFRVESACYSCKKKTPLIHAFSPHTNELHGSFDTNWFGNYEITMDDDFALGSKISEIYPWVRLEYSRTQGRKVHANHCIHCHRMQGNFFTRREVRFRLGNGENLKLVKEVDYFSNFELDEEVI